MFDGQNINRDYRLEGKTGSLLKIEGNTINPIASLED